MEVINLEIEQVSNLIIDDKFNSVKFLFTKTNLKQFETDKYIFSITDNTCYNSKIVRIWPECIINFPIYISSSNVEYKKKIFTTTAHSNTYLIFVKQISNINSDFNNLYNLSNTFLFLFDSIQQKYITDIEENNNDFKRWKIFILQLLKNKNYDFIYKFNYNWNHLNKLVYNFNQKIYNFSKFIENYKKEKYLIFLYPQELTQEIINNHNYDKNSSKFYCDNKLENLSSDLFLNNIATTNRNDTNDHYNKQHYESQLNNFLNITIYSKIIQNDEQVLKCCKECKNDFENLYFLFFKKTKLTKTKSVESMTSNNNKKKNNKKCKINTQKKPVQKLILQNHKNNNDDNNNDDNDSDYNEDYIEENFIEEENYEEEEEEEENNNDNEYEYDENENENENENLNNEKKDYDEDYNYINNDDI